MYDFLLVGSGLYNAVFAFEAMKLGKTCIVLEKRDHIGGNCYTSIVNDIVIHNYGAHIFRTSDKYIWEYLQQFAQFNHFINSPIAKYHNEIYNLPFNMNTFSKMWNITTPEEAKAIIAKQSQEIHSVTNLEEHAISLVGRDIYEKLIKGYTEKQWGRKCVDLPPSIMRRIPLRFTYDNNYYNDPYQGIPVGGYTPIIEKMFSGCTILCGIDFNTQKEKYMSMADKVIYSGTIDSFYDYKFGELEYRSLRFEHKEIDVENFQGVAVVNYTDKETPYTRVIEHKHFEFGMQKNTVLSYEYPQSWTRESEPYYPINDDRNNEKYHQYNTLAQMESRVFFGGRLGEYKYYDMQDTIKAALKAVEEIL